MHVGIGYPSIAGPLLVLLLWAQMQKRSHFYLALWCRAIVMISAHIRKKSCNDRSRSQDKYSKDNKRINWRQLSTPGRVTPRGLLKKNKY